MIKVGCYTEYQWSKVKDLFRGVGEDHEVYKLPNGKLELWVYNPEQLLYVSLHALFIAREELDSIKEVDKILNP